MKFCVLLSLQLPPLLCGKVLSPLMPTDRVVPEFNSHAYMPSVSASPSPHERPTHNSNSWLNATHYHVEDLHLLLFAGFYPSPFFTFDKVPRQVHTPSGSPGETPLHAVALFWPGQTLPSKPLNNRQIDMCQSRARAISFWSCGLTKNSFHFRAEATGSPA